MLEVAGLDDLAEYLGGLQDYAADLSDYAQSRPRRPQSDWDRGRYRRTQSALKVGKGATTGTTTPKKPTPSPFASLPHDHYRVIYSDPPWKVHGVNQYATMTPARMATTFPVSSLNDPRGTVHFMWVVSSLLDQSIELLHDWGYTFRTIAFCWVKTKGTDKNGVPKLFMGQGGTSRGNVEICLEAHSGKNPPKPALNDVLQTVVTPLGIHSAKPAEVRERIIELYPDLPRLEMFARNQWDGWDVFGNQVTKGVPQPTNSQPTGLINITTPSPSRSWWENKTVIDTAEAAAMIGVGRHRVVEYIRAGRLDARKRGSHWGISKRSVLSFVKEERGKGRPAKGQEPKKRMTK